MFKEPKSPGSPNKDNYEEVKAYKLSEMMDPKAYEKQREKIQELQDEEYLKSITVEDSDKYAWPPEPQLNHNQMRLVGWSEEELAGL